MRWELVFSTQVWRFPLGSDLPKQQTEGPDWTLSRGTFCLGVQAERQGPGDLDRFSPVDAAVLRGKRPFSDLT